MRKILIVLLVVFIVIQFIRPSKNIHPVEESKSATTLFQTPLSVKDILQVSCMDCHSNNTSYPWYHNIQPVMWFLTRHVNEGKEHLNFDEYGEYNLRRQYHKMEEVIEVLDLQAMPLSSYTLIHKDAQLKEEEKAELINWAKANMADMKSKYPLDSLLKK